MHHRQWLALPKLIRFMLSHFADGIALGWTCGLLLIQLDIGRIGSMLEGSQHGFLTALFFVQGGLLFATLHTSVAVMNVDEEG